jgi:redox-sensitive bicupin YhaK (pirin superfamily)
MPIEERLLGHSKDIGGGLVVRRVLPAHPRRSVGPFVFFDHFGPITETAQDNHDVRPHPHIGLATVTYLFEGAMMHRDSLGFVQRIEPGAINWMTAGGGIVHSERTPEELRAKTRRLHGLQLWAALPQHDEETAPGFTHAAAESLPEASAPDLTVRVLIGSMFGKRSPVATFAETLYLDVRAAPGSTWVLPAPSPHTERAVYSVDQPLAIDGADVPAHVMAVLAPGAEATISAPEGARYVVIGGAPLDGPRFIWWNFVSSSRERIEQAKTAWSAQQMGKIPGEHEWIPLPDPLRRPG